MEGSREERRNFVRKVIEGRMKGKIRKGKPRIMMLYEIKAEETYEKRECWRIWVPRTCFQANTNDDELWIKLYGK